jgi:hypothetical protein
MVLKIRAEKGASEVASNFTSSSLSTLLPFASPLSAGKGATCSMVFNSYLTPIFKVAEPGIIGFI